ncbi:MAG: M36 family metallopeptidase [Saprospiraceae bacterium]|nr:M36 family metallopeptidase [Saprospiraceae bacterium]
MKRNNYQTTSCSLFKKTGLIFLLFVCFIVQTFAQAKNTDPSVIALNYLKANAKTWHLSKTDIAEAAVQQIYNTDHNGVTHVWLIQRRNGIEVFNSLVNVNILTSGEVLFAGNRFVSNLTTNTTQPTISAADAIVAIAQHLGMTPPQNLQPVASPDKLRFTFAPSGIAYQEMHAKLRYQPIGDDGNARLAWDVDIDAINGNDFWNIRVDALTGAILDKSSWTVHCNFDHSESAHDINCRKESTEKALGVPLSITPLFAQKKDDKTNSQAQNPMKMRELAPTTVDNLLIDDGKYNVLPIPFESPIHGGLKLVQNAPDSLPSPFGWHDTTGTVGADLTITRGNNVHSFLDLRNYNRSVGNEPDGGATLTFDFPYDAQAQSDTQRNLAATNLFYMNNILHDVCYRYGFDEKAGNFQLNNYGRGGKGNDFVNANAQDAIGLPEPFVNNANMATPVDGISGRMQMYVWARSQTQLLRISAPRAISGLYTTGSALFGKRVTTTALSANIVQYLDTTAMPMQGCKSSTVDLMGKIALIDKGGCGFARKALNAQDSGAVACIICNTTTTLMTVINDTFPDIANAVKIPVITLKSADCAKIRGGTSGWQAVIQRPTAQDVGPDFIDGDLDNGIIAHEFGHGVSNRLTGGPANSSCLGMGEQMGEGWSDFMTLMLTTKPSDRATKKRGIGTFVQRQDTSGAGIRRYPYSTDRLINPHTYNNIFLSQASPHPIGEIWASTLWDLYWAMVDKYGWDANVYNTKSGNGKAIQLVFDGMKMQVCSPSFIDGRNAILAADRADYNGENQCLIWDIFAKRGLGYSASGGRGTSGTDNEEAFDVLPTCLKTIKVSKTMTDTIKAGDEFLVTLKAINHKGIAATGVKIVDTIPAGATVVGLVSAMASSSNAPISFTQGSGLVTVQMSDSLRNGDSLTVVYRLRSDAAKQSVVHYFEDFEQTTTGFTTTSLIGTNAWARTDSFQRSGLKSMQAKGNIASEQLLTLTNAVTVTGKQPVFRFFHRYDTQGGIDAGAVEILADNDPNWRDASKLMFKNRTTGLTYQTFPFETRTFWGLLSEFKPTYLDLSGFKGRRIQIRYRFKSNATVASVGWIIDDAMLMDMENYNATARLTTTQGDNLAFIADDKGTIVEPTIRTATKELANFDVQISPNPTTNVLNVNINSTEDKVVLVLRTIQGQEVLRQNVEQQAAWTPLSMAGFANGLYFLSVETARGKVVKKVVKQ